MVMYVCRNILRLTEAHEWVVFDLFKKFVNRVFVFSLTWSLGGALPSSSLPKFNKYLQTILTIDKPKGSLYDFFVDTSVKEGRYVPWEKLESEFVYDPKMKFHDIFVPTTDSIKIMHIATSNLENGVNTVLVGPTGIGKSVVASYILRSLPTEYNHTIQFNFSTKTSSSIIYSVLNQKLHNIKRGMLGAPAGKKAVIFIDNVNMPTPEKFGAQPALELLRQYCTTGSIYDRTGDRLVNIIDSTLLCCTGSGPFEASRGPIPSRVLRYFHALSLYSTSQETLIQIFLRILQGFLCNFSDEVQNICRSLTESTISVYLASVKELLPTPSKTHYLFNLRDVAQVFQGIMQAKSSKYQTFESIVGLWVHEVGRVFYDRLSDEKDQIWFSELLVKTIFINFKRSYATDEIFGKDAKLYGDFVYEGARDYECFPKHTVLSQRIKLYISTYNEKHNTNKAILFNKGFEEICKLSRIFSLDRGNSMLIGLNDKYNKLISELASFISDCEFYHPYIYNGYSLLDFRNNIKPAVVKSGIDNKRTVFMISDKEIVDDNIIEDICCILDQGEIPNLFSKEEYERLMQDLTFQAQKLRLSIKNYNQWFTSRVRDKMHIVLSMSPFGNTLRQRIREFPALVNCCTISWVADWPEEALYSIASVHLNTQFLKECEAPSILKQDISQICLNFHNLALEAASRAPSKPYIVTQHFSNFLSSIQAFFIEKSRNFHKKALLYTKGLEQFHKIHEQLPPMTAQLVLLQVTFETIKFKSQSLAEELEKDTAKANEVRLMVEQEEQELHNQHTTIKQIQSEAEKDLKTVLPILEKATKALDHINPLDIAEIRTFPNPPALVVFTLECIMILLGQKSDWDSIKKVLSGHFLDSLRHFPKDKIKQKPLKELKQKIAANPQFTALNVEAQNIASKSLCEWVFALQHYAKVIKIVRPKRKQVKQLKERVEKSKSQLKAAQHRLREQQAKVEFLTSEYSKAVAEWNDADSKIMLTTLKIQRAHQLTNELQEEKERWEHELVKLQEYTVKLHGDLMLAAGAVSYLGPFESDARAELTVKFIEMITMCGVASSPEFSLEKVIGNSLEIREWTMAALPGDKRSIENAIILKNSSAFSLCIDPQEKACGWIKKLELNNQLKVVTHMSEELPLALQRAMAQGTPLLIEEIGDTLGQTLASFLAQAESGKIILKDLEFPVNLQVKLYFTSKLQNPQYSPTVHYLLNIVDFKIMKEALEEQLLQKVVKIELPEIERERKTLIYTLAEDSRKIQELEESILCAISEGTEEILESPVVVEKLQESKKLAVAANLRMQHAGKNAVELETQRNQYLPIAKRGGLLYFIVSKMSGLNNMYGSSVKYCTQIIKRVLRNNKTESRDIEKLVNEVTFSFYCNISKGLLNKDRLVFSFLIASGVDQENIPANEWNYLINGPSLPALELQDSLTPRVPAAIWNSFLYLAGLSGPFKSLLEEMTKAPVILETWLDQPHPMFQSPFHNLLFYQTFKPAEFVSGILVYIESTIGADYLTTSHTTLQDIRDLISAVSPCLFILTPGFDPSSMVSQWAKDYSSSTALHTLSLTKSQGDKVKQRIELSVQKGNWILLQNLHLSESWMPSLQEIFLHLAQNKRISQHFKLFLTSMPCDYIPPVILQSSLKITYEPPRSVKSNMLKSIEEYPVPSSMNQQKFQYLYLALTYLHAVLLERKQFGFLGWNTIYEFNDSEIDMSINTLHLFFQKETINWKALRYMISSIHYGGRVTDPVDMHCLKTITNIFIRKEALKPGYKFLAVKEYPVPHIFRPTEIRKFTQSLPSSDLPEIFGMHANASFICKKQESQEFMQKLIGTETLHTTSAQNYDSLVMETATHILKALPHQFILSTSSTESTEPLAIFLTQEITRFNTLLSLMKSDLVNVKKALNGQIVMTEDLDYTYLGFTKNTIPIHWSKVAFPSLKPLSSWVIELARKIEFIDSWVKTGEPEGFYISSFFYPMGFLTAVLQTHSRKEQLPLDSLSFEFTYQNYFSSEIKEAPDEGIYVYGFYTEGCRFDVNLMKLTDLEVGNSYAECPVILLEPMENAAPTEEDYQMPVYRTQNREGQLSTTGHSTSFLIYVNTPVVGSPQQWVLRGAALVCEIQE